MTMTHRARDVRDAILWAVYDIEEATVWDIARDTGEMQKKTWARLYNLMNRGLIERCKASWDPCVKTYRLTELGAETIGVTP